jgi:hypothetical protein
MAFKELATYLDLVPVLLRSPHGTLSSSYDADADGHR